MAANDTSAPEKTMVRITKEKPTPLYGPIKMDWKLPWMIATAVSSVLFIAIGSLTPLWWIGWLYAVFAVTVYLTTVQVPWFERLRTPAITVLHRKAQKFHRRITGGDWYLSLDPRIGEVFGISDESRDPPKPIKALGRIRFMPHAVESYSADGIRKSILGVAEDGRNTLAGTLKVTSESLYSVDADTRQRRLAAYAHLLDTLTQGYVHRLAWQDTTLLGEHADPENFLDEIAKASDLKRSTAPNRDVLRKWIDDNNQNQVVHETTITLAVHRLAIRGEAKQMDGDYRKVLETTLRDFYAMITGKGSGASPLGLSSAKFLSFNDLVMLNLLRLDPVFAQPLWQQWRRPRDTEYLLEEKLAWPDASDFRSGDIVRLGETYHLGYYIDEFGESGMAQDAFWELLGVPVPKTVSVVFQMIPWRKAKTTAKRYRTGVTGVNVDRTREDKLVLEEHVWAEEEAITHEREVARSMGQVGRIRGYIDVTGDSPEQAHAYARLLRSAVTTNTPFVIRPLTNRQLRGIEAVMPLARGLR
jgi:hypothetical protein